MGEVGEVPKKVMGGSQSGGNVPQGGDTGGTTILIVDLGPIGGYGEESGGYAHKVSEKNHGEAGAAEGGRDVGYPPRRN